MPDYIPRALERFKHAATRRRDTPAKYTPPRYGARVQYSAPNDDSPHLPASARKHVKRVIGTLLYYGLALDLTLLVALCDLASE